MSRRKVQVALDLRETWFETDGCIVIQGRKQAVAIKDSSQITKVQVFVFVEERGASDGQIATSVGKQEEQERGFP